MLRFAVGEMMRSLTVAVSINGFGLVPLASVPVVRLRIDIDGVLAIPCRWGGTVPPALKIGRPPSGLGAENQQIPAELIIGQNQIRIMTVRKIAHPISTKIGGFGDPRPD